MTQSHGRTSIALVGVILALATMLLFGGVRTESASAGYYSHGFCGWQYHAPGTRCMSPNRVRHHYILAEVYSPAGEVCVGAKVNPDGSGANAHPFTCLSGGGYYPSPYVNYPGSQFGYATIINKSAFTELARAIEYYWWP